MSFFATIFHVILYQPLFNALVFLYNYIPGKDFGVAIIVLTILLRLALYPLNAKALRAQKTLSDLQPKMQEIKERFKGNKDEASRKLLELYQKEKFNPFSAILPILIQLPILIALYSVFRNGSHADQISWLYGFVKDPGYINQSFFGILNLAEKSFPVAILSGIFQFIQSKQILALSPNKSQKGKTMDSASMMQAYTTYGFPIFTVLLTMRFPAALGLYWITTSICSIAQQWYFMKKTRSTKSEIRNP